MTTVNFYHDFPVLEYHPLRAEHMRLSFNPRQLGHEWRVRSSRLSPWGPIKYFARMVLLNLAGVYLFARKMDTKTCAGAATPTSWWKTLISASSTACCVW